MRMAGRMGGKRVTYQNLKIMKILADRNVILIKVLFQALRIVMLK